MSVTASQPSTTSQAEPAAVVSDIPASQPPPAVSAEPPANATGSPSGALGPSGAAIGSAPTSAGRSPSSVPAAPSHGPSPSAPPQLPQLAPAANPVQQHRGPQTTPIAFVHSAPQPQQPQYRGQQPLQPGYPARPAPPASASQPVPSNHQRHFAQPVYPPSQAAQLSYQGQPVHQQGYQPKPQSARPLIIDPPRKISSLGLAIAMPSVNSSNSGFPSPAKDYSSSFPKFSDDLSRIALAIKQSIPEAARQAVRDNWEKCLLGSEFHQAFVLNASMHHSTPSVQTRAVHDFGKNLVANCKTELIGHFSARDIDDVAELILAKASNAFLDKALEMRLATIDAKPLLNALAKAERLGYDAQDLVEVSHGEHVIPNSHMGHMHAPDMGPGVSGPPAGSNGSRGAHLNELQCMRCYRTFTKRSHFDYHASRSVCSKIPPTADGFRYSCPKCGQGFTHPGGLTYHNAHMVCEGGANAASEPQQGSLPSTPVPLRNTASPAHQTMTQTPSSQVAPSSTAGILPANRHGGPPTSKGHSPGGDPYGHLTAEQMEALNAELLQAEQQYAGRFNEAEAIADPEQKRARLESLRNTFGTKQSMIRKKFGVRLRERRTRAEIQAERERMGRSGLKSEADNSPAPTQQRSSSTSAWTAANKAIPTDWTGDSTPSLKRRRVDEGDGYSTPYPQQQTGPTTKVSEMAGGLSASSATAATHDPTVPPSSTPSRAHKQSGARVEIHLPSKPSPSKPSSAAASASGTPDGAGTTSPDGSMTADVMEIDQAPSPSAQLRGQDEEAKDTKAVVEEEEQPEDSENPVVEIDDDSDDDDDDGDDGDIPARLPPSARQSLASPQQGSKY